MGLRGAQCAAFGTPTGSAVFVQGKGAVKAVDLWLADQRASVFGPLEPQLRVFGRS